MKVFLIRLYYLVLKSRIVEIDKIKMYIFNNIIN